MKLNHLDYYRLPWNLTDNSISWLEPTSKCNLYCDGCYRKNEDNHKPLQLIEEELNIFTRLRKCDGVSIAGGDPLTHPEIIEIVRMVKAKGLKPILNTNGLALTKELLLELKKAGVYGFTFHVDSKQSRPGWKNKTETELNELRYQFASMLAEAGNISCAFNSTVYEDTMQYVPELEMLAEAGNISCAFNSTVYEDTMQYVPELVKWGQKHIDIVQVMVFILYRAVNNAKVDFYLGQIGRAH